MHEEISNPNVLYIPTDDPAPVVAEYEAKGWHRSDIYVKFAFPTLCDGKQFCLRFWRPEQPELL